ncbi:HesB/YadR/YfhF family protein [Lederbergia panacisoli]|uniref:HesB/YadR/YfhF family protein n=1 Tax=Lederbergia panacisoli TaxID=1255251 RepID=UPI00214ACB23|nr:HesB/YadR/YfhF family protein [Lederbergia panacisoli]MCR2822890.1 HesB/YadR/YfhF family protein [Lederbergia panacisoli]
MEIHLTDKAAEWFHDEMYLTKGDYVRFYVRYGGSSPIQQGFSLGVNKEEPIDVGILYERDGINYFIENRDTWYFDGHDLYVDYNQKLDEPLYEYKKNNG